MFKLIAQQEAPKKEIINHIVVDDEYKILKVTLFTPNLNYFISLILPTK